MSRDHRLRRRVREYMSELGVYMHHAEPIGPMPRHGLAAGLQPEREVLTYEGSIALNFLETSQGFVTLADVEHPDDLAARIAIMLGAEREGGWLPDVDVKARIVVEIIE